MEGITLEVAQANLDAILATTSLSVRISNGSGDRSVVNFANQKDRNDAISYWSRMVTSLTADANGRSRFGYSLANFNNDR